MCVRSFIIASGGGAKGYYIIINARNIIDNGYLYVGPSYYSSEDKAYVFPHSRRYAVLQN